MNREVSILPTHHLHLFLHWPAPPSLFVLCNTALASSRVYQCSLHEDLIIYHRIDIIPKDNKPPLFCVFVLTTLDWIVQCPQLYPPFLLGTVEAVEADETEKAEKAEKSDDDKVKIKMWLKEQMDQMNWTTATEMRVPCGTSVYGEKVEILCVRDQSCQHTLDYQQVMAELGKPSSANREVYDVNEAMKGRGVGSLDNSSIVIQS
jgi:hypothetical protein